MMSAGKKFGVATAIVVVALLVAALASGRFQSWLSLPRRVSTWNSQAIQGTFAGVQVREIDSSNAALVFYYDLDNETDTDYRMATGSSLVIMSRLKSNGSLSAEEPIALISPALVPAKNKTRIAVEIRHPFIWPQDTDGASGVKFRSFLQGEVAGLSGFVLFDQPAGYQIELPGDWKDLQQVPPAAGPN